MVGLFKMLFVFVDIVWLGCCTHFISHYSVEGEWIELPVGLTCPASPDSKKLSRAVPDPG